MRAFPSRASRLSSGTQVGQLSDSSKSTSSSKEPNYESATSGQLFIAEPADGLIGLGHTTVTSDEVASPSIERVPVLLGNLEQEGGSEGEIDLVPVEVLHDEVESLSLGVVGDTNMQ